jgi:hypothetical protein
MQLSACPRNIVSLSVDAVNCTTIAGKSSEIVCFFTAVAGKAMSLRVRNPTFRRRKLINQTTRHAGSFRRVITGRGG